MDNKFKELVYGVIEAYKVKTYGSASEPMDGDEVESMVEELRAIININEGNI